MKTVSLDKFSFQQIMDCFRASFADYFVSYDSDDTYFRKRWEASCVDWRYSYGIEDAGNLVALMVHTTGIDNGKRTAFNNGTGVIPAYRGKRLVNKMYKDRFDDLRKGGFEKCMLEVITENTKAIRAYESVGFCSSKRVHCYNGTADIPACAVGEIVSMDMPDWTNWDPMRAYYPSWECRNDVVERTGFPITYLQYHVEGDISGFMAFQSDNGYIYQIGAKEEQYEKAINCLLKYVQDRYGKVKINNVPESASAFVSHLKHIGLPNTLDQFEMEVLL